ncbi:MAG: DUF1461 domain-containing protein [Clostridiales bacterium]|nr:DUF1461 domain-containing protein [Clostridiales bacterium]
MRTTAGALRVGLTLVLILCLVAYFAHALASLATDGRRMADKMTAHADTTLSGVDAAEYPALAAALTGYLRGNLPTPQVVVSRAGIQSPAYAEQEMQHLEDIRGLVHLAGIIRYAALGAVAVSLVIFLLLRSRQPALLAQIRPQWALMAASLIFFGLIVAVLLWGVINFEGMFHAFHRVLFRNDLWLLDPQKDLLLQLMPLPFFVSYGWDLLKQMAPVLLILPLAAFGLRGAGKEQQA